MTNQEATILEKEGKLKEAAEGYEEMLKDHPLNTRAYDRLLIIYRKLKEPEKELDTVEKAIRNFEEKFSKEQPAYNKRVTTLSKALLKATGLGDKKGNNLYQPGELIRWKKRRELLVKKLKSGSAKRKRRLKKD